MLTNYLTLLSQLLRSPHANVNKTKNNFCWSSKSGLVFFPSLLLSVLCCYEKGMKIGFFTSQNNHVCGEELVTFLEFFSPNIVDDQTWNCGNPRERALEHQIETHKKWVALINLFELFFVQSWNSNTFKQKYRNKSRFARFQCYRNINFPFLSFLLSDNFEVFFNR